MIGGGPIMEDEGESYSTKSFREAALIIKGLLDEIQAWKRNTSQNRGQLILWQMIQLKQYPKYQSDFKLDDSQVLTNCN